MGQTERGGLVASFFGAPRRVAHRMGSLARVASLWARGRGIFMETAYAATLEALGLAQTSLSGIWPMPDSHGDVELASLPAAMCAMHIERGYFFALACTCQDFFTLCYRRLWVLRYSGETLISLTHLI